MKICFKCNTKKPLNDFHIDKSKPDGRRIYCKTCCAKQSKKEYNQNQLQHIERAKLYREQHKNDPDYIKKRREESRRYQIEHADEVRERILKNRTKLLERRRELRATKHMEQPEYFLLEASKDRARKKGLPNTLTLSDIKIPNCCPVLGIPLKPGEGKPIAHSPSIDRIDNSKGYTPDNIVVVSWRVNDLKKNASIEELEKIVNYNKKL